MTRFPDDFLWGAATSAGQIEGGAADGGRGDSIWDVFARRPGNIAGGAGPATACDHFHRYRADAALMARLGIGAYRFSVAWPRVYPRGYGAVNHAGLDFYDSLTDALLEHGVTPLATLYHWDLPQGLQERGGWPARDTARYFADFTEQVVRRLGDRVSLWATLNEPQAAAHLGHEHGVHAPGLRGLGTALQAAHHLLLAHGLAVQVLRDLAPRARVGIALNLAPVHPAGDGAADSAAAERADGYFNRWYLDPLLRGAYPEDLTDAYRELDLLPEVYEYDLDTIAAPLDFLGVNYYFRYLVAADGANGAGLRQRELGFRVVDAGGGGGGARERTAMGWEVYPDGLTEVLLRVARDYAPAAIYITENGAAYDDEPGADGAEGEFDDGARQAYLHAHLAAAAAAVEAGAPLRGYFVWSLLDNFEWQHGYRKRFGLVHVDFRTGARTPRRSAFWYRDVIAAGGVQ